MSISYNPSSVTDGLVLCLDPKNPRSYSPNVHPYPLDIYAWKTIANLATLSRDYTIAKSPAGGIPMKMAVTGADPFQDTANTVVCPAASGQTWTVSVWVRSSVATTGELFIIGLNAGGSYIEAPSTAITITPSWTRVSYTYTLANALTVSVGCRLDGPNTGGAGIDIWWDGLQLERASAPTTFNPTTNTNGTVLSDLSKQSTMVNNATTYNSAGYLTYDGTTSYTDFAVPSIASSDVVTVEMLAKINTNSGMPFGFTTYDVYNSGAFGFNTNSSDIYGISEAQKTSLGLVGNWKHYVFVMYSTSSYTNNKMYINGVSQTLAQQTGTEAAANRAWPSGNGRISGFRSSALYKMGMDLGMFRIYKKALTQNEINQNFNSLRGRVGI